MATARELVEQLRVQPLVESPARGPALANGQVNRTSPGRARVDSSFGHFLTPLIVLEVSFYRRPTPHSTSHFCGACWNGLNQIGLGPERQRQQHGSICQPLGGLSLRQIPKGPARAGPFALLA